MMAPAESSNDGGRHLDLLTTLPDIVLNHILCLVFDYTNQCTINAIMINRRVFSLAKPIFLSTIVLHSELSVLHLMHHCISPNQATLTAADREHVKCIEINFLPSSQRQTLPAPSVLSAATAFPNLRTLRFRFNAGVPLLSSIPTPELYRQLAADTAAHARWLRVDSPLFDLLSSLKPQHFEWISEVPSGQSKSGLRREGSAKSAVRPIRVLAFRGAFRALIKRWDSLTHVDLDGICLLAKHCTSTFHLALLAKHMRINVNSYRDTLCLFASVPHMLSGSHKCESLVVDGPGAKQELAYVYNAVLRPGTSLTFRGFTSSQCALFKYTFLSVDDQRFFGPVPPEQVFRFFRTGVRELRPREISRKTSPMTASVIRPSATVPTRDKATTGPPTSGEGETPPTLTSILSTVDCPTYIICFIAIPITICCTILFLMILPVVDYLKGRRGAASTTTTSVATSASTAPQDKFRSRGLNLYTESR
ncbi:hypothetical protein DEU56DRAFT_774925 [Suillus clintonianus]|uniref:uncharacterized protein n=1 Tax=Suillus clintonianus TaxID=1904413 RepID=UPI001B88452F|nr:uncharacterized protein DEU56DRAFT_774925 [Suillus clintonianus]KAG2153360.1 hypothetical protein DEU56DRAFT_774925 [Suillus clintonianus]